LKELFSRLVGVKASPIGRRESVQRIGDYTIVRKIGSGGTSDVYLGLHVNTMATVAIKQLDLKCNAASHKEMFYVESLMCGRMDHPNIVSIYWANLDEPGGSYLVMEFVDGMTLDRFVSNKSLLPVETVVDIMRQSAEALRYLAGEGVIHRDIKPGNIILRKDGRVKIADFGCALLDDYPAASLRVAGSLPYMAPEQIDGKPIGHLSDMYSLGAVFYHLLTGRHPFELDDDQNAHSYARKILGMRPTPVMECRQDVPPGIARVVERMLQKKPEDRYESWNVFLSELYRASVNKYAADEEFAMQWQSIEIREREQAARREYGFSFGY
jgi:eukaryotic-like serine/threonine-protein kinase